jgi:pilus assembly protein CpaF
LVEVIDAYLMPILDPIKDLLVQEDISDILISSEENILIERNGQLESFENIFASETAVRSWATEVIRGNGSRIDLAKPIAEVSLKTPYGLLRFHCVLGGECSELTQISIRKHSAKQLKMNDLVKSNFLTTEQAELLLQILTSKENFVVVGSTGSGKTTLLRALLNECSAERVITIEDAPELQLQRNAVSLITRQANHEGIGEISSSYLLREALRMRPDRLVIGEVRGSELLVLLQALNTGHSGAGFTLHANSAQETLSRMLAILAVCGMQPELGKLLIAAAVHWVIEVRRLPTGRAVVAIRKFSGINV